MASLRNDDPILDLATQFGLLRHGGSEPPDVRRFLSAHPEASLAQRLEVLYVDQWFCWKAGQGTSAEQYLADFPEVAADREAKLGLIVGEYRSRAERRHMVDVSEFVARFPELAEELVGRLDGEVTVLNRSEDVNGSSRSLQDTGDWQSAECVQLNDPAPTFLGRYRTVGVLGEGGFGKVYLADDAVLGRRVAVKVPHLRRIVRDHDVELYLDEARILAGLDHPNIVPVFDAGRTDDGLCYVVSKVIEGTSLQTQDERLRSSFTRIADLVASIAEALHHAHQRGLVHRDVKPRNILLDLSGRAYLADFGLALRETELGSGRGYAGTPAYMSPEQARGEGHRIDRRTDIFSLGLVLYELLTGRHPFGAGEPRVIQERIASCEARPPRELSESVPKELERICLIALAQRLKDRYSSAQEFAAELRRFSQDSMISGETFVTVDPPSHVEQRHGLETTAADSQVALVVPKGLRAYDEADADFFLHLLPGPKDRRGLSDALRFWKTRIEQIDPDQTFPVGLIYGPSGCGKSSLIKAGLLPRLATHVVCVYVEAGEKLEVRLLQRIRRCCVGVDPALSLTSVLAAIRRGEFLPGPSKLLIVLDQFEQWLHAHGDHVETELVRALRQCDGGRVQCIVTVRDDFWMMSSRFMKSLEVGVVEGHNAAAVDLFSPGHARKVLDAIGRAYHAIPDQPGKSSGDQKAFLDRAVAELTQDAHVIPVRLALFAEMVKNRPWRISTLMQLGGEIGVRVTFLDETFLAPSAPPEHRRHKDAVRLVLGALLPSPGTEIKGHRATRSELLKASGYSRSPSDFAALLRILDSETRLLTPIAQEDETGAETAACESSYQLTHDYLVPSIREWLTRDQRKTWRGRARLKLEERAALWDAKREHKQLPSLMEWLGIRLMSRSRSWTAAQREMMRRAGRSHGRSAALWLSVLLLVGLGALRIRKTIRDERAELHAYAVARRLIDSDLSQVSAILDEVDADRARIEPILRSSLADPKLDPSQLLRVRLGLLKHDLSQIPPLYEYLLQVDPTEFADLRDAIAPDRDHVVPRLWKELDQTGGDDGRRFRAAALLALYAPEDRRWDAHVKFVAAQLVSQPSLLISRWVEAFRPIRGKLVPPISALFREQSREPHDSHVIMAEILANYAGDDPALLSALLADSAPGEFPFFYKALGRRRDRAEAALQAYTYPSIGDEPPASANLAAGRAANAVIARAMMGRPDLIWPLLRARADPRLRSYLIDRLPKLGMPPDLLIERLAQEGDASIRSALLLCIGGFPETALSPSQRERFLPVVRDLFRRDPDPAVHGASGWLLQAWRPGAFQEEIQRKTPQPKITTARTWYRTALGHEMVVLPGPITCIVGAPSTEPGWRDLERQRKVTIPHSFEIGVSEVTRAQFRRFLLETGDDGLAKRLEKAGTTDPSCPATYISWYTAARFCNWLSAGEDIPRAQWCYLPNMNGDYAEGMQEAPDCLERTGFRLPTEAEWEYACRAGSTTSRCYGDADELLGHYAAFGRRHDEGTSPVRLRLPNDFGLFDVHGNVFEWCHERPESIADDGQNGRGEGRIVSNVALRNLRGGGYSTGLIRTRSAIRFMDRPNLGDEANGFRIARTRK